MSSRRFDSVTELSRPTASPQLWRAPTVTEPVDATVELPGSKSITNRALPLAALADASSVVRGALRSRDTDLMAAGLRALGTSVDDSGLDWPVAPGPLVGPANIDCGLAGTVTRFLLAVAALATGPVRFDGDPRNRERPLQPLIDALRQLGVVIDDAGRASLPLTLAGSGRMPGGRCALDSSMSSQFVSALLMVAARADGDVTIEHTGTALPSLPHIDMTVAMMRDRGVVVDDSKPNVWQVQHGLIAGGDIDVEPDLSNAAPFLAAAMVSGGTVQIPRWPARTTQPGAALPELLTTMGAVCTLGADRLTVEGTDAIHGLDVDLRASSELAPTIAVLAALADSPSTLRGIGHMRGHETDRLAALAKEINGLGGDVSETADGLIITPKPLHGGVFSTYDDHRLATSAAVLGLVVPGVFVENIGTTAKTMPTFVELWSSLLT
jgi:3-phosphoshikimate 1-carboxyvinyltransferase